MTDYETYGVNIMQSGRRLMTAGMVLLLIMAAVHGCRSGEPANPARTEIMTRCIDLFARVKAADYRVMYENEFPYYLDGTDMATYLGSPIFANASQDTLEGIQIDSIIVQDDSAVVFLQLEYLGPDSTYTVRPTFNMWYKMDDRWLKPSFSTVAGQKEYEEEIRIYWDAVREKQAGGKEAGGRDSL